MTILYVTFIMYWALYELQNSRWSGQSGRMNGDFGFFHLRSENSLIVSPILSTILIPLTQCCCFPLMLRVGIKTPLQKIGCGFGLIGLAIFASGLVELKINRNDEIQLAKSAECQYIGTTAPNKVHMIWQLPQFILLAMAAAMVYVEAVVFTLTESPARMKSVVLAISELTVAFGHGTDAFITYQHFFNMANEYFLFAGLMGANLIIYILLAKRYRPFISYAAIPNETLNHLESEVSYAMASLH